MKTVLVVDDSQIMRNIIKNMVLTLKMPCQFVEAANGEDALRQMQAKEIDLVFLDWNMPKVSGIEFLKMVRSIDKYKTLPIIMVTSEAARYSVIEALKNGATDYITKPVDQWTFQEKIAKLGI
ncbi:MAG: response regulator [Treponema sp.]|jgi:two-component system chemotaxis response regulator CheY|nr:response regulator [Treponema sp.]